jgi:hypothetical protein
MDKDFDLLVSDINNYIINNPGETLHILISSNLYQEMFGTNRVAFNLEYEPPKFLGHSFSIRDDINTCEQEYLITSEREVVGAL